MKLFFFTCLVENNLSSIFHLTLFKIKVEDMWEGPVISDTSNIKICLFES